MIVAKYLAKEVLLTIFMVLMVFMALDFVFALLDELDNISEQYPFWIAVSVCLKALPANLFEWAPMVSMLGALLAMGNLASHSELIALRAGRFSQIKISILALIPCLLFSLFILASGQWLAPPLALESSTQRAIALGKNKQHQGIWHKENNAFVNLGVFDGKQSLLNVSLYEFNPQGELIKASFAESAKFDGQHWQLSEVRNTHFSNQATNVTKQNTLTWRSQLTPEILAYLSVKPDNLSITDLQDYSQYLDQQSLDSGPYWLAFWRKLLLPVSVLSLVFLALCFIAGPLREVTLGLRLVTGIGVGISFMVLQNLLGPATLLYQIPPVMSVLIPSLISFAFGLTLIFRRT